MENGQGSHRLVVFSLQEFLVAHLGKLRYPMRRAGIPEEYYDGKNRAKMLVRTQKDWAVQFSWGGKGRLGSSGDKSGGN